jgi:hypothetical protein
VTESGPFVTTAAHHGASQQHGLRPHRADLTVRGRGRSATGKRGYVCAPLNRRSRWNSYTPLQQDRRYHCFAYETSQFVPRDRLLLWVSRNFPQTQLAKFGIIVKLENDPFLQQLLQFFITLKALPFSATYCSPFLPTTGKDKTHKTKLRVSKHNCHHKNLFSLQVVTIRYTVQPTSLGENHITQ